MYAVIRAGGKQYRVAPGDVIKVEKTPATGGKVEFTDVLAVSGQEGQLARPSGAARVTGSVVEQGRADKILVFHFKRKKQYKKIAGHRQPFTAVRITEIAFDGQKFTAPELPVVVKKAKPAPKHEAHAAADHEKKHAAPKAKHVEDKHKKPAAKKADHKKKK
jgi:large subunit ribosomal protein L21